MNPSLLVAHKHSSRTDPGPPPALGSGIKHYRGNWGLTEVTHLLKRTMFGAKKEDIDHFHTKSLKKAIKELIYTKEPLGEPPLNNYNDDKYIDPEIAPGQPWTTSRGSWCS